MTAQRTSLAAKPLSVCLYTDTYFPSIGGAQTVLDHLARELMSAGHRPLVFAPAPRQRWDGRQVPYPVIRFRRPRSKRIGVRLILPHLLRLHWRHQFDVLHCHAAYPQAFVARTMRRLTGVPYVVRPHGADILPGEKICASHRLELRMRSALIAADAVIAQGDFLRQVIATQGVASSRLHIINNGVDLNNFRSAEPFPHPRPYILGLGNLIPHKGFDLLLRGYALLPSPRADLLIGGEGSETASLKALAQDLGIASRVKFLGLVTGARKISLYRSAEFLVCPSRREPFANVILEALASGLPVVATNVGGNREVITNDVNGRLCTPESPESLAAAMQPLLEDPQALGRLRHGVSQIIRQYDWPGVAAKYVSLYLQVMQNADLPTTAQPAA